VRSLPAELEERDHALRSIGSRRVGIYMGESL
jgi:hypothetical protein